MGEGKILFIDHDSDIFNLAGSIFQRNGFETQVAVNSDQVYAYFEKEPPDLVIWDPAEEREQSSEITQALRSWSRVSSVLLTLDGISSPAMELAEFAGDHLIKPFDPETIFQRGEALVKKGVLAKDRQMNTVIRKRPYRPTVSVVLPTLNEANNLPLLIPYLPMNWIDEVILVDGRSSDGTVEVAKRLLPSIRVINEIRRGKGLALRAGYKAAQGDIIIVLDADGSHDPREIPRYIRALLEGADFVRGSRFAPGGGTTDMPRFRKLGNSGFVTLVNLLFDVDFTDLCYGYHAFWRYCLDDIDLDDISGFEIDTAIYIRALKEQLKILEVPSFEGFRFRGQGKLRTFPDGWRVLRVILDEWMSSALKNPNGVYIGFRGAKPLPYYAVSANHALRDFNGYFGQDLIDLQSGGDDQMTSMERARANMQLLYTVSAILSTDVDLRALLQRVLLSTLESIGAASGSIVVLDEAGNVIESCASYQGLLRAIPPTRIQETLKEGLAGWVIQNRKPTLVKSTRVDSRWQRKDWEEGEEAIRSALSIPLLVGDRVMGVLTLARPGIQRFTEEDLERLTDLDVRL